MKLIERFFSNLMVMGVVAAVLYAIFPGLMQQVIQSYSYVLGPVIVVVLLAAALPRDTWRFWRK